MRIAGLHVIKRRVQPGIHRQVKVLGGVLGQGHAGGGSLGVVDEHVDAAELLDGLIDYVLDNGLVVGTGADVRLDGEHLDVIQPLQLLLGVGELLYVAPCNDKVCPFLCVGGGNAVADGTAAPVAEGGAARAGDNGNLTL